MRREVDADPIDRAWIRRLTLIWIAVLGPLIAVAGLAIAWKRAPSSDLYFFLAQDTGLIALQTLTLALASLPSARVGEAADARWQAIAARRGPLLCAAAAVIVGALAFAGWFVVCQRYPLTADEMWAVFDARIFERGQFVARVAPEWRTFVPALQPQWRMPIAGDAAWASTYLPVNAAVRALFAHLGSPALAGAAWSALSIAAVFDLARRQWPARPDAALVAVLALATSAQVLLMAMTPFSMSAHLALNLAWLWLFRRGGGWGHGLAALVAFAATGLHQLIFHPLFAAPFVLQLWLGRRWRLATFHTLAYAAIIVFWASYWGWMLAAQQLAPAAPGGLGLSGFVARAADLLGRSDLRNATVIGLDLIRFVAWQNPLVVVLAAAGAWTAVRNRDSALWPLVAGIGLTLAAVVVLEPSQGHGWGYRYLHGLIGNVALLAAAAWIALVRPGEPTARRAWASLGLSTLVFVLVAAPLCAVEAHALIRPYARSEAAIRAAPAEVVVVDASGLWYGRDLVRNDPFLETGPKVMNLENLTETGVRVLCARYRVALFDRRLGSALGLRATDEARGPRVERLRAMLAAPACGGRLVTVGG